MYTVLEAPENDRERFTCGDCHVLAMAIHKKTGWPTYCFLGKWSMIPDVHAFVITPDGEALDIDGKRPVEALLDEWNQEEIVPASFHHLRMFHARLDYYGNELPRAVPRFGRESYRVAREAADRLLEEVGL
jgi:hypothetical protein